MAENRKQDEPGEQIEPGRRGRPAKQPPAVDPAAVKRVKQMVKGYSDAKLRARFFENKRRSLIRCAGVDLPQSEKQGIVIYDEDKVSHWPEKDKAVMNQYITDKQTALCIEKGVASIADAGTRAVAEKTILEGKSCEKAVSELHIPRATTFREKARSMQWIAYFMERTIGFRQATE